jgi:hypothetical protein
MTLRGPYREIERRVAQAEARLALVPRPGCPTCAAWPAHVTLFPDPPLFGVAPGAPAYCRPWARLHEDGCSCLACHPRRGWPASFRCPRCLREPTSVVRVVHTDTGWPRTGGRADDPWRAGQDGR